MQRHEVVLRLNRDGLRSPWLRYALLGRIARIAARQQVLVLAFGMGGDEVRLVVQGREGRVLELVRLVKSGTARQARARGHEVGFCSSSLAPMPPGNDALLEAVVWAHRAPLDHGASGPLATPWSSHRDLLGFRRADFYDADVLLGQLDPNAVHARLSHRSVPRQAPPEQAIESLDLLLRVAAAVLGVLPGDRRCFRLFAQVARRRGHRQIDVAAALALTARRVRQLERLKDPLVSTAMRCVADPALRIVP